MSEDNIRAANIKDNGDGYIKYVQIIKVKDTVAPKLTCKDTSICITSNCTVFFTMPLAGTDNCAAKVNFRTVMTRPDNSTETKTNVSAITGSFISGTYNFAVYGNDGCGNESACTIKVEVKDCKAPTPYCLDALATVVMPSNGSVEIWARDFNINSEDNCTPKDKLKYSFTKNTADANKILACKDITNGREKIIPLDIYVTDEAGNSDFCKVVLSLQDNGGAPGGVCPDNLAAVTNVTGKLYTESKARGFRIDTLADENRFGAVLTKKILANIEAYLACCQLGITMASLGLGWVGEPTVAAIVTPLLQPLGMSEEAIHLVAFLIGFLVFSSLHIVIGEQVPKTFAIRNPEPVSLLIAYPLHW